MIVEMFISSASRAAGHCRTYHSLGCRSVAQPQAPASQTAPQYLVAVRRCAVHSDEVIEVAVCMCNGLRSARFAMACTSTGRLALLFLSEQTGSSGRGVQSNRSIIIMMCLQYQTK